MHRLSKNMYHFDANDSSSSSKKKAKKPNKDMGEYIDYEEID